MTSPKVDNSAAKFDRIRRSHQSEVAEDYVEMIAEYVDGIIVGSAIVETIEQGNSPTEFLDRLKN